MSETVDPLVAKLPKQLRKCITTPFTTDSIETIPSTSLCTPVPPSELVGTGTSRGDDLGDVIVRKPKRAEELVERAGESLEKLKKKKRPIPAVPVESMKEEGRLKVAQNETAALPPPRKKTKTARIEEVPEHENDSLFPFSIETERNREPVKPSRNKEASGDIKVKRKKKSLTEGVVGGEQPQVVKEKKKKKVRKSMDEIDAIFR